MPQLTWKILFNPLALRNLEKIILLNVWLCGYAFDSI